MKIKTTETSLHTYCAVCADLLQSCPTLCGPIDYSLPDSSVHGILQNARVSCHAFLKASVAQSCLTLCDPTDCRTPGFPVHHQLLEFAQTHVHRIGDSIQPSHPLLSFLLLPSTFPSIRVFSNKSALCIRWPKYWSFSFSISPSNDYSGQNGYIKKQTSKNQKITGVSKSMKKLKPSQIAGGNVTLCSHVENSLEIPLKLNIDVPYH